MLSALRRLRADPSAVGGTPSFPARATREVGLRVQSGTSVFHPGPSLLSESSQVLCSKIDLNSLIKFGGNGI